LRGNLIRVVNIQPDSRFVIGPWAVAGHINTGWPEIVEKARPILQAKMIAKIEELWREAVKAAIRGEG
jgi:hypothetical protein